MPLDDSAASFNDQIVSKGEDVMSKEEDGAKGIDQDDDVDDEHMEEPPSSYEDEGYNLSLGENPTHYRTRDIDEFHRSYGTGRRKTAVARVWIKPGMGQFTVNNKSIAEYFPSTMARYHVLEPFIHTETSGMFDVYSTVKGGGRSGQAGALRLGIARAIEAFEPSFRPVLKEKDLLTRDPRRVERKKPGQPKARKKRQWVKR